MRSPIRHIRPLPAIRLRVILGLGLALVVVLGASAGLATASVRPGPAPEPGTLTAARATTTTTAPPDQDPTKTADPATVSTAPSDTRPSPDSAGGSSPSSEDDEPSPDLAEAGSRNSSEPDDASAVEQPDGVTSGVESGRVRLSDLSHDPAAAGVSPEYRAPGMPSPAHHDPDLGYRVRPSCATKCITSGVAYANGSSADLVVTTDTPARIWIAVWDDEGYNSLVDSGWLTTSFTATFDDLQPGASYYAMAVAEDVNGNSEHAYGSFEMP